jgi:tRNA U34 5-carboxymethylaminomethyl modifying GTPase MnmE/TrmE
MSHNAPFFNAAKVSGDTRLLANEVCGLLECSKLPEVQALAPRMTPTNDVALTLVFVGQYNAGKSTLIKALTGRDDVAIDPDVCTHEVTAYAWHDLRLLDTPGVQAGMSEHDARTEKAILEADLVIFVITAELFSEASARYFRRLMLDGGKARESLLVVNKMTLDGGSEDVKRPYIDQVCQPLTSQDFNTVFMDAKCYLDSIACMDDADRQELRTASCFDAFVDTLNCFAREHCDLGRLTKPLFLTRSVAQQAAALAGTDQPAERAAIELLGRLEACIQDSKMKLRSRLHGLVGTVAARIERAGDTLADVIHEGTSQEKLDAAKQVSEQEVQTAHASLGDAATAIIQEEVAHLEDSLAAISRSSLGRRVMDDINQGKLKVQGVFAGHFDPSRLPETQLGEVPKIEPSGLKAGADVAQNIGGMLANWAAGPKAGGGFLSAAQAAGGEAHRFVYDVGKFFGKNFKPWEAVKWAQWLGNVGKALGVAGQILSVVAEIHDEIQDQKRQLELAGHRNDCRAQFREMAASLRSAFETQYKEYEQVQFDAEIGALRSILGQIVSDLSSRSGESKAFTAIAAKADELIRMLV